MEHSEIKCAWLHGDRCKHGSAKMPRGELPCVFKMHDGRISGCKYKTDTPYMFGSEKCNKLECPGILGCSKCDWNGNLSRVLETKNDIEERDFFNQWSGLSKQGVHETHNVVHSDSSKRDEYCTKCGLGDDVPGLELPCTK